MRVLNEQVLRIDNEQDEFLEVYELILDQALTYKKELYISEMLALGEEAKATLKPFVEAVMRRQFVRKIPNDNAIDNMCQIYEKETLLMEKEEEIEGLKEKNEHLQQLLK